MASFLVPNVILLGHDVNVMTLILIDSEFKTRKYINRSN